MSNEPGIDTSQGGLPQDQQQNSTPGGGRQMGGGPERSDVAAPGGSSGSGGYGNAQNQQNHQGQARAPGEGSSDEQLSRGERFDEAQGGGRGADAVSYDADDLAEDQAAHQDRGQNLASEGADGADPLL